MNKLERINELNKQIEKLKAEINKIEHEDTLEQYVSDLCWAVKRYTLDEFGRIKILEPIVGFDANEYNPYCHYMTEEYVNKAAKIKKFNDMLMAFKWCYDKDYEPDWTQGEDAKYRVVYNFDTYPKRYYVDWSYMYNHNEICFSSEDIAQKCADWLNSIDPNGELIK